MPKDGNTIHTNAYPKLADAHEGARPPGSKSTDTLASQNWVDTDVDKWYWIETPASASSLRRCFPFCCRTGFLPCRSILVACADCAERHHTRRLSCMMRFPHSLGIRPFVIPSLFYSVNSHRGRGPEGDHHATQGGHNKTHLRRRQLR